MNQLLDGCPILVGPKSRTNVLDRTNYGPSVRAFYEGDHIQLFTIIYSEAKNFKNQHQMFRFTKAYYKPMKLTSILSTDGKRRTTGLTTDVGKKANE